MEKVYLDSKRNLPVRELLKMLLERKDLFSTGLCMWVTEMYYHDYFTLDEKWKVHRYIDRHEPKKFVDEIYFWKRGSIKPRINWIKKHIQLLENEKVKRSTRSNTSK